MHGVKLIICSGCGEERPHKARGMCSSCYQAWYRRQNPQQTKAEIADEARDEVVEFVNSFLSPHGHCRYDGREIEIRLQDRRQRLSVGG